MEAQGRQSLEREGLGRGGPKAGGWAPARALEPAAPPPHPQPLALPLKQNLPLEALGSAWSRNEAWFGGARLGPSSCTETRAAPSVSHATPVVKAEVREATGLAPSAVLFLSCK